MIPSRPSKIFRSRWSALLWAGGVIWTAVTVAGFGDHKTGTARAGEPAPITDVTGTALTNQDVAALKHWLDGNGG